MGQCESCGNHYKNTFKVTINNASHEFDCFACAIHMLAPVCASCSVRILGPGVEEGGMTYCSQHCLRMAGHELYVSDLNSPSP